MNTKVSSIISVCAVLNVNTESPVSLVQLFLPPSAFLSLDAEVKGAVNHGGNKEAAKMVGAMIAKRAIEKGITEVVFDRGGYLYHGRVQVLAEAAREAGLKF